MFKKNTFSLLIFIAAAAQPFPGISQTIKKG
jgi:hypothetical protein